MVRWAGRWMEGGCLRIRQWPAGELTPQKEVQYLQPQAREVLRPRADSTGSTKISWRAAKQTRSAGSRFEAVSSCRND